MSAWLFLVETLGHLQLLISSRSQPTWLDWWMNLEERWRCTCLATNQTIALFESVKTKLSRSITSFGYSQLFVWLLHIKTICTIGRYGRWCCIHLLELKASSKYLNRCRYKALNWIIVGNIVDCCIYVLSCTNIYAAGWRDNIPPAYTRSSVRYLSWSPPVPPLASEVCSINRAT